MITFFCRGHGFGHASRSLRLIAEFRRRGHDVTVVSYGYGAQYFNMMGVDCIDAGIVDRRDFAPEAVRAFAAVLPGVADSDLFVVDELHYLPNIIREHSPAPIVMLTDWLFAERDLGVDSMLSPARRTFMVDFEEAHPLDEFTAARVEFVGPVAPSIVAAEMRTGTPRTRLASAGRRIVLTVGGSAGNPASLRMLKTMVPLLLELAAGQDELLILGDDPTRGALSDGRVHWLGLRQDAAEVLGDADLAVCDGNGMTACELAYVGVPTIAYLAPVYADAYDPVSVRRCEMLAGLAPLAIATPDVSAPELDRLARLVLETDRSSGLAELRTAYISPDALVDLILQDPTPRVSMNDTRRGGGKV